MKLSKTIKRIVALGTGATMLGATVLGAMAADLSEYPKPMFIKDGKFDGLIVIGADADTQDMLGAMDIISSLQAVAVSGSSATSATVETVGDVYEFAKASDKLNLGESLRDIRSKVSDTYLPIVLADSTLTLAKGTKYDYEQELSIDTTNKLVFFADKDYQDEKPTIGLKIARNAAVLNYTLDFTKDATSTVTANDMVDFEDRQIEMLGETFDIIGSDTSGAATLDLMRGALKPTLEEGETATYKINNKDYEVTALIIDDTNDKVKFKINGEVTDSMAAGDVYEVADGTLVGVREIMPNEAGDVTQDMVEFYLGAKKIVLTNGDEVEIDNEDVSKLNFYMTNTSTATKIAVDKMVIEWIADDDLFITEDNNEVAMPGLESIKFYMNGFYKGKQEQIKLYASADDTATIEAPLSNYDVKLDVLYGSTAGLFDMVGSGTSKKLITKTCKTQFIFDMDTDEYFVVTKINGKEGETAVAYVSKVDDTDGITVKDYAGNVVAADKKLTKTFDLADMSVSVDQYNQAGSWVNFSIASAYCNNATLVTKEGLKITLPGSNLTNDSVGNLLNQYASTQTVLTITEEDKDENIGSGVVYYANFTFNADSDAHARLVSKTNLSGGNTFSVDDTKVYVGYINSSVSSKITEDKVADQNELEIEYPGEETYGNLFIGSKASKVTTTSGGESVAVTKIEVGAAVLDSSLASYTNQNLIVVGGPAINRAAAALLGKTYPAYGADSGIPENAAIIKLVENADKVAMIVAGWEADDTQRACRVVAESEDYALSGKEVQVTGTSMTDITVGVPAVA